MNKRVLITGAGGFVCGNIGEVLAAHSYDVLAVDRAFDETRRVAWSEMPNIELIEANVTELPSLGVDYVIHGAAITASPDEVRQSPEDNLRAHLDPLLHVLSWAAEQNVRRVILMSSAAIYSDTTPDIILENSPPSPVGIYPIAKHLQENLAQTLRAQHQRDVVAIRLSSVYGLWERVRASRPRVSLVLRLLEQALTAKQIIIDPQEPARDWTFAADIGHAVHHLLSTPSLPHSLYNVAAQQMFPPQIIAEHIQRLLPDVTIQRTNEPTPAKSSVQRGCLSHSRLQQDTGFNRWTPFADGLAQTLRWLQPQMEVSS